MKYGIVGHVNTTERLKGKLFNLVFTVLVLVVSKTLANRFSEISGRLEPLQPPSPKQILPRYV